MTKDEFARLYERALVIAGENAERQLGRPVPRAFEIELHGLASAPRTLNIEKALDAIYLGPDRFYRIIDVAVIRVSKEASTVFLRISGHEPGPLDETRNQPPGSGPFKQLLPFQVKVID